MPKTRQPTPTALFEARRGATPPVNADGAPPPPAMPASSARAMRGVALVSVLLIVALASALAYQMISRHALAVAYARQAFSGGQAREYALGAEAYARQLLFEDWAEEDTRGMDTLLEAWAAPKPPFKIQDGELTLSIVDLDSRLNLNGVAGEGGPDQLARLKCLTANLALDPNLADAWLDWVDDDSDVQGFGAEDDAYLMEKPPYRAANRPAASVSELLALTMVGLSEYGLLRAHVTVAPAQSPRVNVNTAGYEVLRCLNLPEEAARELAESEREFEDVAQATAEHAALGASAAALAVTSEFFEVRVHVEAADTRAALASMLHRDPTTGAMRLLARDFSPRFAPRQDGDIDDESDANQARQDRATAPASPDAR